MQSTTYSPAFVRAIALARSAASNPGSPEAASAAAMLAKHCAKHNLSLADVIARAAQPDTKADNASKAGSPRPQASTAQAEQPKAKAKAEQPKADKPKADAKPEAAAKPDRSAERTAAQADRAQARKLAADAVRTYYGGASLPFKAAADRFADLRLDKAPKRATERQAALLASLLCADGDNIAADGTFKRAGFIIDGRRVQPETGALSDMLNRVVSYVSGPTSGQAQADTVLRINLALARTEITAHLGGALAAAALARIDALAA